MIIFVGAGTASADPDIDVVGPALSFNNQTVGTWDANRCIQISLGLHADGIYGQETFDAVQAFQARAGLAVDGVVGPLTGDLILLAIGYSEGFYHCYQYLPSTYSLDSSGAAEGEGGSPIECLLKQGNAARGDLVKILGGDITAKNVVRTTGRGWATPIGLVKCTLLG